MIRVQGQTNDSHDPKLKVALVGSPGARTAAERTVSAGDIAALRKEIAALGARVAALEVKPSVTALPKKRVTGNTPKLTGAEKQRAYRERKGSKKIEANRLVRRKVGAAP
jgi:hypothetical protein